MESMLKADRRTLLVLILHEIIKNKKRASRKKKSIWKAFKSLSEDLGDDFMDFPDFEHSYLKLEKGECDLEYDGRMKYNRNLCDLPMDIIQLIAAKLTTEEKWLFRESSLSLRKMNDLYLPGCEKLQIEIHKKKGEVIFDGENYDSDVGIKYREKKSEETGESEERRSLMDWHLYGLVHKQLQNGERTVEESMIRDTRPILENPKTRLVDLSISSTLPANNSFFEQLKPLLKNQENIRKVYIDANSPANFHLILSCLKPETLEEIELESNGEKMDLSGIVEMDQLKHAKRVTLSCTEASYPLRKLVHLEEFDGLVDSLKPEDVLAIKNESIRTGKMKTFNVETWNSFSLPRVSRPLGRLNREFHETWRRRYFRIQNSEELIKMEIASDCRIKFSRETRR